MAQYIQGITLKSEYDEEFENTVINDEYRIWKKNVPFLYDMVITHELEWPSLTVQWMPEKTTNNDYSLQKLILGTHTDNTEINHLMIAKNSCRRFQQRYCEIKFFFQVAPALNKQLDNKITIETKIIHEGEVNRVCYMPQNSNIIASKTSQGDILVFDYSKHPPTPESDSCKPNVRLKGLTNDGYGLDWNHHKQGYLVSGNFDNQIGLWDISSSGESTIMPLQTYRLHSSADVKWHHYDGQLFVSCSDDRSICLYDIRSSSIVNSFIAHNADIYSCDFNPLNEFLLATGSADNTIGIWGQRLHTLLGHSDDIVKVQWSAFNMGVLASCSNDRRVIIWDLAKQNDEIQNALVIFLRQFIHAGHKSRVNDFSWNGNDKLVVASVEQDNILQVWQMNEIYYDKQGETSEMEIEKS